MVSDGIKAARIQARCSPLIGLTWEPVSLPVNIGSAIKNATNWLKPQRRPAGRHAAPSRPMIGRHAAH
jgi:hypothetical protein